MTLDELIQKTEILFCQYRDFLKQFESLQRDQLVLTHGHAALAELTRRLEGKQAELKREEDAIAIERETLEANRANIRERELALENEKQAAAQAKAEAANLARERDELNVKEEVFAEQKRQFDSQREDMVEREEVSDKEKALARERKELLDARERKLEAREAHIQRLTEV